LRHDHSRITDERGRHIPVTRVRARSPSEAAERDRRKRNEAEVVTNEPPLRSLVDLKRKLDELSSRVRRLAPPAANDPETFHEERSEIARELQRLASRL
jgi:hypothetical protein